MVVIFKKEDIPDWVQVGKNFTFKPPICFGEWSLTFNRDLETNKFYYPLVQRAHPKKIIIGDDVQIGSFVNIDRGSVRDTTIGNGVKIDSSVNIAHNAIVGDDTILILRCVLLGSSEVGSKCYIGCNSVIIEHIKVGNNCFVEAGAIVNRSMPDNTRAKTYKTRLVGDREHLNTGKKIRW